MTTVSCKRDREIKVYAVAKPPPAAPHASAADPHAGLPPGTPMPGGVTGDPHAGLSPEQMAAAGSNNAPPFADSAPPHWRKQPLSPMRLASYLVAGEGAAKTDISFSILHRAPGGVLANVNRWRDQLGQPPVDEDALKAGSQPVRTSFGEGIAVEIEGSASNGEGAANERIIGVIAEKDNEAWFFKMRGNPALTAAEKDNFLKWVGTVKPADPAPPSAAPSPVPPPAAADGRVTWQLPQGWSQAAAAGAMRYATIGMSAADGATGELVVSHFPGDVGGDLENVNRWRQQAGVDPVDEAGLAALVTQLTAGPETLSLIDITGPKVRLTAGWTRHGPDTWFFKLTGPDSLVAAEKARFTAFLESVRFTPPE